MPSRGALTPEWLETDRLAAEREDRTVVAADDAPSYARKLGIQRGQVVQEWGWDEDTDDDIRADVEDACGGELLDEDSDEVIDVVLLWGRAGDAGPAACHLLRSRSQRPPLD